MNTLLKSKSVLLAVAIYFLMMACIASVFASPIQEDLVNKPFKKKHMKHLIGSDDQKKNRNAKNISSRNVNFRDYKKQAGPKNATLQEPATFGFIKKLNPTKNYKQPHSKSIEENSFIRESKQKVNHNYKHQF